MITRRQLIHGGLACNCLALGATAVPVIAVTLPEGRELQLTRFLKDLRYPQSIALAAELRSSGTEILVTQGDVTDIWIQQLSKQWRNAPAYLTGSTGKDVLFVLETLAWDHGMRVVHRQEIVKTAAQLDGGDVPLVSWVIAPKVVTL